MKKSFREILAEHLAARATRETPPTAPPEANATMESASDLFSTGWRLKFTHRPASGYKARPKPKPAEPKPVRPEVVIPLEQLPPPERARVKSLIELGATNLTQGLSASRLKKAHRALAKTFHPDRQPVGTPAHDLQRAAQAFMRASNAYNGLLRFLKTQERSDQTAAAA